MKEFHGSMKSELNYIDSSQSISNTMNVRSASKNNPA